MEQWAYGAFVEPTDPRKRLRALRKALGLTQQQVAEQSGGRLDRVEVNKVENGRVGFASYETREGLARAFGLLVDDLSGYLDSEIGLDIALRMADEAKKTGVIGRRGSPRLRDRDSWNVDVVEARRIFRSVPDEYFDHVGLLIDTLRCKLDAQLIGELARSLWEADLRGNEDVPPASVAALTAHVDSRKRRSERS